MQKLTVVTRAVGALVIVLIAAALFLRWQSEKSLSAEPLATIADIDKPTPQPELEPTSTPKSTESAIVPPEATADLSLPANVEEPITIRLVVTDSDYDAYQRLIEAFEAENPTISVELISQNRLLSQSGTSNPTAAEKRLLTASGADVLVLPLEGDAILEGLRLDLKPYLAADASLNPEDFYPGLMERYLHEGRLWAVPHSVDFMVLVYNKVLFDEAAVAYPAEDWSRDTFLETTLALTIRDSEDVVQWGFLDKFMGLTQSLPGLVGQPFGTGGQQVSPRFTDPVFVAGMAWYVDLFLEHEVAPYWSGDIDNFNDFLSQSYSLVQSNEVAMWTETTAFLTNSYLPGGGKWGIVSPPGCDSATTNSISISAFTEQPAAAWRLLSFMSEHLVVGSYPEDLPRMPARRSVAESQGFYDHKFVSEGLAEALRQSVASICPMPGITAVEGNKALATVNQLLLEQILTGEQLVGDALSQAQEEAGN